jgi:hypothetical protein
MANLFSRQIYLIQSNLKMQIDLTVLYIKQDKLANFEFYLFKIEYRPKAQCC